MKALMLVLTLLALNTSASQIPERAGEYFPILVTQQKLLYPSHPDVTLLAGQIEQETCPSLTSQKCWNPRTELKTDREYGFGLGQLTVTKKFNNFEESKKWDPSLQSWQWGDRYNPVYQLRAIVAYMRNLNGQIKGVDSQKEQYAMSLSAYNGGLGGLNKDRTLCKATPRCDNQIWFDNVEKTSFKDRTAVQGYGKSFFEVNREYVRNIFYVRSPKYRELIK
jgi:hypothetical protein